MNLKLDNTERLWCILNRKGELLIQPTQDYRAVYQVWKQNEADSRIFMLLPTGFPPIS